MKQSELFYQSTVILSQYYLVPSYTEVCLQHLIDHLVKPTDRLAVKSVTADSMAAPPETRMGNLGHPQQLKTNQLRP